jgi:hypothetical protein
VIVPALGVTPVIANVSGCANTADAANSKTAANAFRMPASSELMFDCLQRERRPAVVQAIQDTAWRSVVAVSDSCMKIASRRS